MHSWSSRLRLRSFDISAARQNAEPSLHDNSLGGEHCVLTLRSGSFPIPREAGTPAAGVRPLGSGVRRDSAGVSSSRGILAMEWAWM